MKQAPKSEDEDFVEVHIHGPMTIHTMSHVLVRLDAVKKWEKTLPGKAQLAQLKERLAKGGVTLDVVS